MGGGRGRPERPPHASGGGGGLGLGFRRGRSGLRRVRVTLLEALDAAGRVDELGLAREERVAVRADLEAELGLRALGFPRVPARAMHDHFVVLGVNLLFHVGAPFTAPPRVSGAGTAKNNMSRPAGELPEPIVVARLPACSSSTCGCRESRRAASSSTARS